MNNLRVESIAGLAESCDAAVSIRHLGSVDFRRKLTKGRQLLAESSRCRIFSIGENNGAETLIIHANTCVRARAHLLRACLPARENL
jgi:hypothetical protein